jgi:chromosome segregation ATPase
MKKGAGPRDVRQEPDAEGTGGNFRVDRVFDAPRGSSPQPAAARVRTTGRTVPPLSTDAADAELALRRSLSRLQRQLADAQRELANKDEELAAEVERRRDVTTAAESLQHAHNDLQTRFEELTEYRARTAGLDQRLQDSIATADELTHQLDRERAERAALAKQFEEANGAWERARTLWRDESALTAEQHASELAHAETKRAAAVEAIEAQMSSALERQRETHAAELAELKSAHERSVAALRGELEPKVAVARSLAEEIERLTSQLNAAKAEHVRDVTERTELHKWEIQQQAETQAAQLETERRHQAAELAKRDEEATAKTQALAQAERNTASREKLWEQTTAGLRESQKKLQQELAEAKEKCVQADASKWSIEQRLVATLSTTEKLTEELKQARERLDAAEGELKRDTLDRKRFIGYLEEGLAMLGAIPPTTSSGEVTTSSGGLSMGGADDGLEHETVRAMSPVSDPANKPGV